MNYNPTNTLGITARLGWLGYNFKNPAMFGDAWRASDQQHGGQGGHRPR